MPITAVTKNAIREALNGKSYFWWGAHGEEVKFLDRLYDLDGLDSQDKRYKTFREDIVQHFILTEEWDVDWVFDDPRTGFDDDETFLRFLAETVHPVVRTDATVVRELVALYNAFLVHDRVELYHASTISSRAVYGWRPAQAPTISDKRLRELIANAVYELKCYDVAEFCEEKLGLGPPVGEDDDPCKSKIPYVLRHLKDKSGTELREVARVTYKELEDEELGEVVAAFDAENNSCRTYSVKNLIFAADGPKPEIVLRDAVTNDIEIVKNAEFCLVYDRPVIDGTLSWRQLIAWWAEGHPGESEREIGLDLYDRLRSTVSDAERVILDAYAGLYREHGYGIPALIPQVYLHYDPYTAKQRGKAGPLDRQRMDFLLLLPNHGRAVIELDGIQHYADEKRVGSPRLYAAMVSADRRLKLAGYDVYRFGGYEIRDKEAATVVLREFFEELLRNHDVVLTTQTT